MWLLVSKPLVYRLCGISHKLYSLVLRRLLPNAFNCGRVVVTIRFPYIVVDARVCLTYRHVLFDDAQCLCVDCCFLLDWILSHAHSFIWMCSELYPTLNCCLPCKLEAWLYQSGDMLRGTLLFFFIARYVPSLIALTSYQGECFIGMCNNCIVAASSYRDRWFVVDCMCVWYDFCLICTLV